MSSKRADGRTPRTAIRATLQQANIFSNPGKPTFEATLDSNGATFIIKEDHGAWPLATEERMRRSVASPLNLLTSGTFPSGSKG
jgi:hypothetical protein